MPIVVREVVEVGPDLIDVFVSGRGLLSRVRGAVEGSAPWIERLATLTEGERPSPSGLDQRNLFDQVEVVLAEIAERYPLVLVLGTAPVETGVGGIETSVWGSLDRPGHRAG
jgi:hypothetical protein